MNIYHTQRQRAGIGDFPKSFPDLTASRSKLQIQKGLFVQLHANFQLSRAGQVEIGYLGLFSNKKEHLSPRGHQLSQRKAKKPAKAYLMAHLWDKFLEM